MSKIKNDELDHYGAGPFEQQQFGTAGVEGVNLYTKDAIPDTGVAKIRCEGARNEAPVVAS